LADPIQTLSQDPLDKLAVADPKVAGEVAILLESASRPVPPGLLVMLADEAVWGLSQEKSFGRALAVGLARLMVEADSTVVLRYRDEIRRFARSGWTIGRLMAVWLAPVLKRADDELASIFLNTVAILRTKGLYTLTPTMEGLAGLLGTDEPDAARSYLELLAAVFARDLSYDQCRNAAALLPKAVSGFVPAKRLGQIQALSRVVREDFELLEPLLAGFEKGLDLLAPASLAVFVAQGLAKFRHNRNLGKMFLALASRSGIQAFQQMQVAVSLAGVQIGLNRYLQARTGQTLVVQPISRMSPTSAVSGDGPRVSSDGKRIFLTEEIASYPSKQDNARLYKILVRLESAYAEFNTYNFDLERATEKYPRMAVFLSGQRMSDEPGNDCGREAHSDLERFFALFAVPMLAADLFTMFEQARLRRLLTSYYPGLVRQSYPIMCEEALRIRREERPNDWLFELYLRLALEVSARRGGTRFENLADRIRAMCVARYRDEPAVEASAALVYDTYETVSGYLSPVHDYQPMPAPFGWRAWPHPYFCGHPAFEALARDLKTRLARYNLKAYSGDIKRRLIETDGRLTREDLQQLVESSKARPSDLDSVLHDSGSSFRQVLQQGADAGDVFWYSEWDHDLGEYLPAFARVAEKIVPPVAADDFYGRVESRYYGVIRHMRHAFELLKPQGMKILRNWVEGDQFDTRALADYALEKRLGGMPSDRLYIKRVRHQREVAVLVLVDLSRSTANLVAGSRSTVLEVEKEALVIFCEALVTVGDMFAIAGFSGIGRLGIDYFKVKEFDEQMSDTIRQRIGALAPQRNTRMGAAVRHAVSRLEQAPANLRLLIVLGDGFPNDHGYKRDYAVADTRKALQEARARNVRTHAVTVNLPANPKLDGLYGGIGHSLISDARELPDRLWRIYRSLTRY
jgi:nitric oxide reductase NorD protein